MLYLLQIISNDTTTILVTGDSFTYPGTYVSDFFMYCELPPSRRKRSVDSNDYLNGYNISISNNGVDFTEELTTIIYDQQCYDCNLTSSISCVQLVTIYLHFNGWLMEKVKVGMSDNNMNLKRLNYPFAIHQRRFFNLFW